MANDGDLFIDIASAIINAANNQMNEKMVKLFKGLETAYSDGKSDQLFLLGNTRLANAMQRAVLVSYDARVHNKRFFGSYRTEEVYHAQPRLSGGVLRNALSSPAMVKASAKEINFVDVSALDTAAAHWYRLNFGAGNKALSLYRGRSYRVVLGGDVSTVRFNDEPSAGFTMPFGVWAHGGNQSSLPKAIQGQPAGFYPLKNEPRFPTEGIAGRRFLDAGLKTFAEEFGNVYGAIADGIVASRTKAGAAAARVEVTGPAAPPIPTPTVHVDPAVRVQNIASYVRNGKPVSGYRRRRR